MQELGVPLKSVRPHTGQLDIYVRLISFIILFSPLSLSKAKKSAAPIDRSFFL